MPLPPDFKRDLWAAADLMRANTGLEPSEYTQPVLALLFLRFADARFAQHTAALAKKKITAPDAELRRRPRPVPTRNARYDWLLQIPDGGFPPGPTRESAPSENSSMKPCAIERLNPDLRGALPETFAKLDDRLLRDFLQALLDHPR